MEPSSLEIFLTVVIGRLGDRIYSDYINRLGFRGDERLLDFGSGAGNPARHLARLLSKGGGKLTCVDISQRWMQLLQKRLHRYTNVSYHLGDITRMNFPPCSQDAIFIHFVLHDIPAAQRANVVRALCDLLVRGGKLYIREPQSHLSRDNILDLMQANGLRETSSTVEPIRTMGDCYGGVFIKM